MMETRKTTTYLSPPEGNIPRNLSFPQINENNFTLLKTGGKTGLLQGPRRVLRLCVFALLVPSILIAIPLYVRLVLYPPVHYPMMPTDQRLINRHVSGIWCQAQSTHMNGSFNTYKSHGFPGVDRDRRRYEMVHTMRMKDDIKEYWGFHLLKGSTVKISSCTKWDGGQMMILRGVENLRRCAWIGEEDSSEDVAEDDDIISRERHRIRDERLLYAKYGYEDDGRTKSSLEENQSEERRKSLAQLLREAIKMSKGKKEILKILHTESKPNKYISHSIPNDVDEKSSKGDASDVMHSETDTTETMFDVPRVKNQTLNNMTIAKIDNPDLKPKSFSMQTAKRLRNQNKRARRKRLREERRRKKVVRSHAETLAEGGLPKEEREVISRLRRFAEDDDTGGAFEELDTDDILSLLKDPKNDRPLNVSSVEMIIGGNVFYPEGLKFERGKFNQTNINDHSKEEHKSSYSSSEEALASCEGVILTLPLLSFKNCNYKNMVFNRITYDIPVTGTYYFVFSSDNEIYANDIYFNLTMEKVVYNTDSKEEVCVNTTDCSLPLSFWSDEQAVVEVPQGDNWETSYVLDTHCEPRVYVYLTLLLLVPLFIMCCALH